MLTPWYRWSPKFCCRDQTMQPQVYNISRSWPTGEFLARKVCRFEFLLIYPLIAIFLSVLNNTLLRPLVWCHNFISVRQSGHQRAHPPHHVLSDVRADELLEGDLIIWQHSAIVDIPRFESSKRWIMKSKCAHLVVLHSSDVTVTFAIALLKWNHVNIPWCYYFISGGRSHKLSSERVLHIAWTQRWKLSSERALLSSPLPVCHSTPVLRNASLRLEATVAANRTEELAETPKLT